MPSLRAASEAIRSDLLACKPLSLRSHRRPLAGIRPPSLRKLRLKAKTPKASGVEPDWNARKAFSPRSSNPRQVHRIRGLLLRKTVRLAALNRPQAASL